MRLMLKTLMLAAMALTAISAVGVASAQAATEFENPAGVELTVTSTPDGTGTTAHFVIVTPAGSLTAGALDLDGTTSTAKTFPTQTLTPEYTTVKFNGILTTLNMHSCDHLFSANGAFSIKCSIAGDAITWEAAGCKVSFPEQALTGITYANINGSTEVTVSTNVPNIHGTASGCPSGNGAFTTASYTTGNTILTGVEKGTTTMKPIRVS